MLTRLRELVANLRQRGRNEIVRRVSTVEPVRDFVTAAGERDRPEGGDNVCRE